MNDMKNFEEQFDGYLKRAGNLLGKKDESSLIYCALELRKAVELVTYTQFKNAFQFIFDLYSSLSYLDFLKKTQSASIKKMHKMLKRYCLNYSKDAQAGVVYTFFSSTGNEPLKESGKSMNIPGELVRYDYGYLSALIHYEKEYYPRGFEISSSRLKEIFDKLTDLKDNYAVDFALTPANDDAELNNISDELRKISVLQKDEKVSEIQKRFHKLITERFHKKIIEDFKDKFKLPL